MKVRNSIIITRYGFIVYGIMVSILFYGLSFEILYPETSFGNFISHYYGKIIFGILLVAIFKIFEKLLNNKNIYLYRRKEQ